MHLDNTSEKIASPNSPATSNHSRWVPLSDGIRCAASPTTWSMMSFPTYKIATGIADLTTRKTTFPNIIAGLVSHTNRKNRGKFPNALIRSRHVSGATPVDIFGLMYRLKVPLFSRFSFLLLS